MFPEIFIQACGPLWHILAPCQKAEKEHWPPAPSKWWNWVCAFTERENTNLNCPFYISKTRNRKSVNVLNSNHYLHLHHRNRRLVNTTAASRIAELPSHSRSPRPSLSTVVQLCRNGKTLQRGDWMCYAFKLFQSTFGDQVYFNIINYVSSIYGKSRH